MGPPSTSCRTSAPFLSFCCPSRAPPSSFAAPTFPLLPRFVRAFSCADLRSIVCLCACVSCCAQRLPGGRLHASREAGTVLVGFGSSHPAQPDADLCARIVCACARTGGRRSHLAARFPGLARPRLGQAAGADARFLCCCVRRKAQVSCSPRCLNAMCCFHTWRPPPVCWLTCVDHSQLDEFRTFENLAANAGADSFAPPKHRTGAGLSISVSNIYIKAGLKVTCVSPDAVCRARFFSVLDCALFLAFASAN